VVVPWELPACAEAVVYTAQAVVRHKDTASDKDLEIVEAVDIGEMARALPSLRNVVATGQKAMDAVIKHFLEQGIAIPPPAIGACAQFAFHGRGLRLYRMPSSSRAYPLPLERKADIYRAMFEDGEGGGGALPGPQKRL
jgi:G:T/U-mismatch repair DNA glycosylase